MNDVIPGPVRLFGASDVRALAAELGLRPTKKLGQNFVHDANTVRRIVRLAGVEPGAQVLEVGPGLGSLTLALLDAVGPDGAVVAVEVDPVLGGASAGHRRRAGPRARPAHRHGRRAADPRGRPPVVAHRTRREPARTTWPCRWSCTCSPSCRPCGGVW